MDLAAGTLTVRRSVVETDHGPLEGEPKADSRRTVALPAPALEALRVHRDRHPGLPSARVFGRSDGAVLRHGHVQYAWHAPAAQVGLPWAHLHDLRHAGLTLASQSGATLREVMHRAGHRSPRAAMIYQHLGQSRDTLIAERMAQAACQGSKGTREARAAAGGPPAALPGTAAAEG